MSKKKITNALIDIQVIEFSMRNAIEEPGMYTIDEMAKLVERYDAATKALENALKEDYRLMPPTAREKMSTMLAETNEGGIQALKILEDAQ